MCKYMSLFLWACLLLLAGSCEELDKLTEDEEEESTTEAVTGSGGSGDTPGEGEQNTLNQKSPLAVNIAPLHGWTPGWVFIDQFPKSRGWVSNLCDSDDFGTGPALSLDENGWVKNLADNQCAVTSVMMSQKGHYPTGEWVLLWEGEGTLTMQWDVTPDVVSSPDTITTTAGGLKRMSFSVSAENQSDLGIALQISALESDYIKNIRMIPPGGVCGKSPEELSYFSYCASERGGSGQCGADETCHDFENIYWDRFTDTTGTMNAGKAVFHPLYAESYRRYRAIRFMKWSRVEESEVRLWSERAMVTDAFFTDDTIGVPIEYWLALANLISADAFVNVPMKSDDAYQTSMATLVKNLLREDLKIFVEYGNEIFNQVEQLPYNYAIEQGEQLGVTGSDWKKGGSYAGYRSGQIFDLWRSALGERSSSFGGVLTGFNPVREFTDAVLGYNNSYEKADYLAINGYVGPSRPFTENKDLFDSLSLETLLTEITDGSVLDSGASLNDLRRIYEEHAALAAGKNLKLIAYEGGNFMELDGAPEPVISMFYQANRNRNLGNHFVTNIKNFLAAGGQEFFYFLNEDLWTDEGAFGARRYQDESRDEAVIFDVLMDYIESTECGWTGC